MAGNAAGGQEKSEMVDEKTLSGEIGGDGDQGNTDGAGGGAAGTSEGVAGGDGGNGMDANPSAATQPGVATGVKCVSDGASVGDLPDGLANASVHSASWGRSQDGSFSGSRSRSGSCSCSASSCSRSRSARSGASGAVVGGSQKLDVAADKAVVSQPVGVVIDKPKEQDGGDRTYVVVRNLSKSVRGDAWLRRFENSHHVINTRFFRHSNGSLWALCELNSGERARALVAEVKGQEVDGLTLEAVVTSYADFLDEIERAGLAEERSTGERRVRDSNGGSARAVDGRQDDQSLWRVTDKRRDRTGMDRQNHNDERRGHQNGERRVNNEDRDRRNGGGDRRRDDRGHGGGHESRRDHHYQSSRDGRVAADGGARSRDVRVNDGHRGRDHDRSVRGGHDQRGNCRRDRERDRERDRIREQDRGCRERERRDRGDARSGGAGGRQLRGDHRGFDKRRVEQRGCGDHRGSGAPQSGDRGGGGRGDREGSYADGSGGGGRDGGGHVVAERRGAEVSRDDRGRRSRSRGRDHGGGRHDVGSERRERRATAEGRGGVDGTRHGKRDREQLDDSQEGKHAHAGHEASRRRSASSHRRRLREREQRARERVFQEEIARLEGVIREKKERLAQAQSLASDLRERADRNHRTLVSKRDLAEAARKEARVKQEEAFRALKHAEAVETEVKTLQEVNSQREKDAVDAARQSSSLALEAEEAVRELERMRGGSSLKIRMDEL